MASYIPDGYSRPGFIKASETNEAGEGLWDSLDFVYRPASRLENVKHDGQVSIALQNDHKDPEAGVKAEKLACKFVADHIVGWSLKDGEADVPCAAESCERISAGLFQRLYGIIRGSLLNDVKPAEEKPAITDEEQAKN